ncbi:GNAT family N-acetyltransferase [Maricaulis sp.]|uniref:GNAT family N-acetyltransferase n=1 Tax=Maricaulis sp. TaxID=1486257 RepID=UPI002623031C|nr:GNAT family N-acetyltransferase [Maricaulis sp.]
MPAPVYSADMLRADTLSARQRAAWTGMRNENFALASPYFALGFTDILAAARSDTHVLAVSRNGTPAGFLPLHLSRSGVARPVGGPLGDHHGLITGDPDLDLESVLPKAGFGVLAFHGALADQTAFARHCDGPPTLSWVSDLCHGYDRFIADCTEADAKAMRNIRARQRKLDKLDATVTIRIDDRRREALDALIAAKRGQYRRTHALDTFQASWARRVVDDLFECRDQELAGVLSTLEIDGQLAAAHFGMRSRDVLHYWFPVFWPDFAHLGPGLTLYLEIARQLSADGITAIHLGPGEYDFKKRLSNAAFGVVSGQIRRPTLVGRLAAAGNGIDRLALQLPLGRFASWPGRAIRRIDKWAAVHAF